MLPPVNTRQQGDLGELSAGMWLESHGALVAFPFSHSPDWDLVAEMPSGRLVRVQAKTSTCYRDGRWQVSICTRGGNQSWSGTTKHFSAERCDYLFVLVGDGRRWAIPSDKVGGGTSLLLGGPKYEAYEVARGEPLLVGAPS